MSKDHPDSSSKRPLRIRQITGIHIHQLTLPESLAYATKLRNDEQVQTPQSPLAGPSSLHRSASHTEGSRRERRISTSTITERNARQRSSSTSFPAASPAAVSRAPRATRPRAPTLAGEALEVVGADRPDPALGIEEDKALPRRRLARSFIALRFRPSHVLRREEGNAERRPGMSGTSSPSPPSTPRSRPTLGQSPSRSSLGPSWQGAPTRKSTISNPSPTSSPKINGVNGPRQSTEVPLSLTASNQSSRRSVRPPTINTRVGSTTMAPRSPLPSYLEEPPSIPFYISPIHHPSTHPHFLDLSPDDFASWAATEELAGTKVIIELWYEDDGQWKTFPDLSKEVNLDRLRLLKDGTSIPDNTLLLTFGSSPSEVYYLPTRDPDTGVIREEEAGGSEIVERSARDSKMKRGAGVGALHQLVNMQTVLVDTQRGIDGVRHKVDRLLSEDADWRALRREVDERQHRCLWISQRTEEVEKSIREVSAHSVLRERSVQNRRTLLERADEEANRLRGRTLDLLKEIDETDLERNQLLNMVHHYRMHHVQTLDSLFPIVLVHPPTLLYTIFGVPLPIPLGPKDPAPPLSLPSSPALGDVPKVDERTTSAALGYVAMVVQLLGNLGGALGGLSYPITCAGSRSLVKDVVSVMQGPRSFPLYAKGVERYRFEYAVFLLNKNIESLMQEAHIRLLDMRHTLPNLKVLLLTLSSPSPHPGIPALSRPSTFVDSRASSRQNSDTWPKPFRSPARSGTASPNVNTPSPVRVNRRSSALRRSLVSASLEGREYTDEKETASVVDDDSSALGS